MSESTVDQATADHVRQLLAEARLVESAFEPTPAATAAPAAPTVPVPPPGYTLRTTHRTTADGGSEVVHEVVPLAPVPAAGPVGSAAAAAHSPAVRRSLPDWLTGNTRVLKAMVVVGGIGTVAGLAAVYGPAVGAGAAAAAAGLWAATLTILKFVAAVVVGVVVIGALTGSGSKKKTGTFEGTIQGTWKQD
ncbi:hypothetical protein GTY67_34400 [Streptomyces sp. SID8374]|uniref:hypothetical protein n=1 Tax=Streptomyces sp. SID8374 TaxID=2690354 RepID=UPI00136BC99C|nr:hypothetical protein [Streptomyces sp. SID8374]MYX18442.1 hypothetical protein [Streptomyces sp. SID8374]